MYVHLAERFLQKFSYFKNLNVSSMIDNFFRDEIHKNKPD
jgi:hypothetical protein